MSLALKVLLGIGVAAAATVIVACGGESDPTGSNGAAAVSGVGLEHCGEVASGSDREPDVLVVSDLPLQGDSADRSAQMNEAVTQALDQAGWMAGETVIGFQACDDSLADTGLWDERTCKENATAYAADDRVIGVIGTYNSGCAQAMIPILNQAADGAVPMVSPGNTAICLTRDADTCTGGEPASLYPSGKRNYARVVPNDAAQGAGLVSYAAANGMKKVAVLNAADDATSLGQAATFVNAAPTGGVKVTDRLAWDPGASDYRKLMRTVAAGNPDAILLAGLTEQNGARLIRDKVAVLGPNSGKVALLAPDGFAQQSTIDEAGEASAGMIASVPGRVPELLPGAGKQFVRKLQTTLGGQPVELYAPYAGQAAQVLLDSIATAGPQRGAVAEALHGLKVRGGITGDFRITATGDPDVSPITISQAGKRFRPVEVIEPDAALVAAAHGG